MKIAINDNNEIISFASVGKIDNGIEVEDVVGLEEFKKGFAPGKFLYVNEEIVINPNYIEPESGGVERPTSPQPDISGADKELRKTYGNLQMSSVQTSKMVMNLSQQVAQLTKQNVELQKQIIDKGVE